MDGVVGCMPLCPHHVSLPDWRCARPRLTTLPGHCCQEWVCDDDNHITEVDTMLESTPHEYEKQNDLTGNELLVMAPTPWDSSVGAPNNGTCKATGYSMQAWFTFLCVYINNLVIAGSDFVMPLCPRRLYSEWISFPKSDIPAPPTCFLQTTDWSPCSATCGMGVSSRVTNSNAECQLVKETRLCQIRECGSSQLASPLKVSKKLLMFYMTSGLRGGGSDWHWDNREQCRTKEWRKEAWLTC